MDEKLLFKCIVHTAPVDSFTIQIDDDEKWNSKYPPIVDILVVLEEDIDHIPNDYYVVLNQSGSKGCITLSSKNKAFIFLLTETNFTLNPSSKKSLDAL